MSSAYAKDVKILGPACEVVPDGDSVGTGLELRKI